MVLFFVSAVSSCAKTVTFVRKSSPPAWISYVNSEKTVLIPGRVMLVSVQHSDLVSCIANVHNHGLSLTDSRQGRFTSEHFISVSSVTPEKSSLILRGDLNATDDHKIAFFLFAAAPVHGRSSNSHHPILWHQISDQAVEIKNTDFSHFKFASNKQNSLTRTFWFTQPWLCTSLPVVVQVLVL